MDGEVSREPVDDIRTPARRTRTVGRRWKFLAEAGGLLDASLDYQTTLTNVVRLAVPTIADYAAIALVADDGSATWGYSAHRNAGKASLAERLRAYHPNLASPRSPLLEAIRTGGPQLVGTVDDAFLRSIARDDAHLALLRELAPTSYLAIPLSARGRVLGILLFAVTGDSGRRYAEGDVALATEIGRRAALAVDHALLYRAAEQARQAREEMVAVVSHDLKNPLSTIQMAVSFLLEDIVPDDEAHRLERQHLRALHRAAVRMYRLIHDLLDVSSIEGGQLHVERAPQPVRALMDDALDALQPLATVKHIALATEVPAELPPVLVDRERLLQVFTNLGGNAIKFTPEQGRVTIRARLTDDAVEFSVSDTGPGIADADLSRVFDRFWQVRKTVRTGSGLGLAIARGIVEAHGGRIGATSVLGQGSTFWFTMPVATADSEPAEPRSSHVQ